jgi:hypothetical protein
MFSGLNQYSKQIGMLDVRIIFVKIRGEEQTLRQLRTTLVHELVHYRFRHLPYNSKEYAQRIKLILNGKQYPRTYLPYPVVPFI